MQKKILIYTVLSDKIHKHTLYTINAMSDKIDRIILLIPSCIEKKSLNIRENIEIIKYYKIDSGRNKAKEQNSCVSLRKKTLKSIVKEYLNSLNKSELDNYALLVNDSFIGPIHDDYAFTEKLISERDGLYLYPVRTAFQDNLESYIITGNLKDIKKIANAKFGLIKTIRKAVKCSYTDFYDIISKSDFFSLHNFNSFYSFENMLKIIGSNFNYPISDIAYAINNYFPPNISLSIINKTFDSGRIIDRKEISAAIHIHAHYFDVLKKIIDVIKKYNINYTLLITYTSNISFKELSEIMNFKEKCSYELIPVDNRGRDILPWLKLSEKLSKYDICGHFHTKKSLTASCRIAESWMDNIINSLLKPGELCIQTLSEREDLGLIIPDIPNYFFDSGNKMPWLGNSFYVNNIWKKITGKNFNFSAAKQPVMPYGSMFWYKPKAIELLTSCKFSMSDFPEEPLPLHGTAAHAIERLPVYIAWHSGYDFLISKDNTLENNSIFFYKEIFSKFDYSNLPIKRLVIILINKIISKYFKSAFF